MKKILVPTNFSETANNALNYATALASLVDASIYLFHTYHVPVTSVDIPVDLMGEEFQLITKEKQKQIQEAITFYKEKHPFIDIKPILEEGFMSDTIKKVIEEELIDLIVMGTEGAEGYAEVLLGTNAAALIGKIKIPLIIIPDSYQYKPIQKIVYATDFLQSDIPNINKAAEFAKLFQAELQVIHVATLEDKAQEQRDFRSFVIHGNSKVHYNNVSYRFIDNESVSDAIHNLTKDEHTDMFVMLTHKRSFMQRILHPSLSKKIAYHTSIPMLVLMDNQ
jgi:nucleotide-binding universal stress UspA family protein